MTYNMISFLKILLSIKRKQLGKKEEAAQFLLEANQKEKQAIDFYSKEIAGLQSKFDLLDLSTLSMRNEIKGDAHFLEVAKYKENYYNALFDFLNKEKVAFFKLHFDDFRLFVLKQKIGQGTLSKAALEKFITDNNAEVGLQSIDDYVNAVNASFSSMKLQTHIDFFSSLNRKLDGMDVEMSSAILMRLAIHRLRENNLITLLLIKYYQLMLNDFIYLMLDEMMDAEMDEKVLCLLEKLVPVIENVIKLHKHQQGHDRLYLHEVFANENALKPYLNEFMDLSVHNNWLMRIISLREDLLDNLDPHGCIQYEGHLYPKSLLLLKMVLHDDIVFRNLMNAEFFTKVYILNDDLVKYGIDKEEVVELISQLITDRKKQEIWNDLPLTMMEFVDGRVYNKCDDFKFRIAKRHLLRTWTFCVAEIEANRKIDEQDFLSVHFTAIDNLFGSAGAHAEVGELMLNDDVLMPFFTLHVKRFITPGSYYYSKQEISNRMIDIIDRSSIKHQTWAKITADKSFIAAVLEVNVLTRNRFLSFSPDLKDYYFAAIKKVSDKKEAPKPKKIDLTEKQLIENKKYLIKKQQGDEKTQDKKVAASLEAHSKASRKNKQKAAASKLKQEDNKPLILSEEDKKTFEEGIRAAMAGNPDMVITWTQKTNEYPDHFVVDFSQIDNTIKVNGALNQNYWFASFLAGKKEEFFKTCVPAMLKNHLSREVLVDTKNIENGILRVTPHTQCCSYPEKMHEASFKHLNKYAMLSVEKKSSPPAPNDKQLDKRPNPYRSFLAEPTVSLIKAKEAAQNTESAISVASAVDPLMQIKTWMQEAVTDHFPDQHFRFLTMEKQKTKCIIKFNLKGAPCLSNKEQKKLDTYVVMKSIVFALQELSGKKSVIKPDNLDPKVYRDKECEISIDVSKESLDLMAKIAPCKLREQFNYYLKAFQQTVNLYRAIYACEQEANGHGNHEKVIVLNHAAEKEEVVICQGYQRLVVEKEQSKCIKALFGEVSMLNEMEANTKDVYMLEAIKAHRYVCYHRLFDNLTAVFNKNNNKTSALFANASRDVFRHGYKELPANFAAFLQAFIETLMKYKKESQLMRSTLFVSEKKRHLSFNITQEMHAEWVAGMKLFVQEKSNHAIGERTRSQRIAAVPRLEKAIKKMSELTTMPESQKRAFILSMASLIGEVNKTAPYGDIYGEMGTHKNNVSEMPADLMHRVYHEHWCSPKQSNHNQMTSFKLKV